MRRSVVALLLALPLAGGCRSEPGGSATASLAAGTNVLGVDLTPNATLQRVVDGDTIDVRIGSRTERVRLIGINTPETKKPDTPVECYGPEASAYAKHLLAKDTALHLERDLEARDTYGRLLAYVYRTGDGMFVNLELVAHGDARLLTIAPNDAHADQFAAAATAAKAAGLGLWGACTG
jgi:micrococcal nuclease